MTSLISNGESGLNVRTTLNNLLGLHVNVKDFGALGDNSTNDTAAIQAAIDYASQNFLGAVYFPPGNYWIGSSNPGPGAANGGLKNNNAGFGGVALIGAGTNATALWGNFYGYIIDQNVNAGVTSQDPNFTGITGGFKRLEGMRIVNNFLVSANCTSGSLSGTTFTTGGSLTGSPFRVGLTVYNTSTGVVYGQIISGSAPTWTLDTSGPTLSTTNFTAQGYDQSVGAVRWNLNETGSKISQCILGGWTGLSTAAGSFNTIVENVNFTPVSQGRGTVGAYTGNTTLISCVATGWWVGLTMMNANHVQIGCRTESNALGIYLGLNPNALGDAVSGFSISGWTTERCASGLVCAAGGSNGTIEGSFISGTTGAGPAYAIQPGGSISGNGSTVTVVIDPGSGRVSLDLLGWGSGSTRKIWIEDGGGPYSINGVTATRVNKTTFTYSSAVTGASGGGATWSFGQQVGMAISNCSNLVISGLVTNVPAEQCGIDLYNGGVGSGGANTSVTFIDVSAGTAGWKMAGPTYKAQYKFIGCDQPAGNQLDARGVRGGMQFNDLPGSGGVVLALQDGMQFDITDCGASGFLATATGGGTPGTAVAFRSVRYNSSLPGWQVIG